MDNKVTRNKPSLEKRIGLNKSENVIKTGAVKAAGRSVLKVIDSTETTEGEGFVVHRPFPTRTFDYFDPFLMLDEMGPMDLKPGEAKGAPDHPHRGFETVTYMLEGKFRHRDSQGHAGTLAQGDVQGMTADSGVVHSEI